MLFICLLCSNAWATQEHADPEGLYSHQISHIFFMFSMVVLIVQIHRSSPLHRGWNYIGMAALLFLLWNITVFTVHWIREYITPDFFSGSSREWTRTIDVTTWKARIFYSGKIIDHILAVGALIAFLTGIRTFMKDGEREEP